MLRITAKSVRNELTPEQAKTHSTEICRLIEGWQIYQDSKNVAFFSPLNGEPDLMPLAEKTASEKAVCFPRVTSYGLELCQVTDLSELKKGAFTIKEPCGKVFDHDTRKVEIIFVPALAFDNNGNRLGFGKGYFDRFLSEQTGIFAGVCFSVQMIEKVPAESHDVRMHYLITEKGIFKTH